MLQEHAKHATRQPPGRRAHRVLQQPMRKHSNRASTLSRKKVQTPAGGRAAATGMLVAPPAPMSGSTLRSPRRRQQTPAPRSWRRIAAARRASSLPRSSRTRATRSTAPARRPMLSTQQWGRMRAAPQPPRRQTSGWGLPPRHYVAAEPSLRRCLRQQRSPQQP